MGWNKTKRKMKTYIITEEDVERLRCNLDSGGDEVYWYISQLDNWEETLEYISDVKLPHTGKIEENDNI